MSNDMSMDEMIEVLARYRYNAKHDADRIKALEAEASGLRAAVASLERVDNLLIKGLKDELNTLRASSFVTAVPVEEYEKLKAEVAKSEEHNAALCERLQDLNGEVHTASCTNARLHSQFANSEQENARLKAEVERLRNLAIKFDGYLDLVRHENERLRKAGDAMKSAYYNSQFAGMVPPEENPDTEEVMVRVDNAYKAVEEAMANWNTAKEGKPSV